MANSQHSTVKATSTTKQTPGFESKNDGVMQMRFDRKKRYEVLTWSDRKKNAALQKPAREFKKNQKKYPLIADQLEVSPVLSEQEELQIRQNRADSLDRTMRNLEARVWRKARRQY
ncbi:MAG TPA: hypothetical protein VGN64_21380, partial [Dyadobacter sp.]|nr:hypothetical protein [Dyadobacter sp.]